MSLYTSPKYDEVNWIKKERKMYLGKDKVREQK